MPARRDKAPRCVVKNANGLPALGKYTCSRQRPSLSLQRRARPPSGGQSGTSRRGRMPWSSRCRRSTLRSRGNVQRRIEPEFRMRRPGLEPGFRRWQRLVITTTLSAHACAFALCALQHGIFRLISLSKRSPNRAVPPLRDPRDGRWFWGNGCPPGERSHPSRAPTASRGRAHS